MATTPSQASSPATLVKFNLSRVVNHEPATVEESPEDLDLISVLRRAAAGAQPIDSLLDALADAARVLSGSDGTALALETKGLVVCRARSGTIAPALGSPMNSGSGISGESLRTATILVCHDALTDGRVDNEVCRILGIRSIAVIPVRGAMGAVGILEAFSTRPNAFDGDALSSLRALSEIAEAAYRRDAPAAWLGKATVAALTSREYAERPLLAEEVLSEVRPSIGRFWTVVAIAVGLLMVVAVAWWSWQAPDYETASLRAANAEQPRSTPARETLPKPGAGEVPQSSDHRRPDAVQNAAELIDLTRDVPESDTSASSGSTPAHAGTESVQEVPLDPPDVVLAPSSGTVDVAELSSIPVQFPAAGPRISDGVVEPILTHKIDPIYPAQARTQHLTGKVILSATIEDDGSIKKLSVVSGSPILSAAAETAVRQWHYRPAMLNGSPIVIQKEITILFTLP